MLKSGAFDKILPKKKTHRASNITFYSPTSFPGYLLFLSPGASRDEKRRGSVNEVVYTVIVIGPMFSLPGGICVITPNNIGPKELERRIVKLKPVCVVAAPCDHINRELLDVVDQVRKHVQFSYVHRKN